MKRRSFFRTAALGVLLGITGCSSWWNGMTMRSQSPETPKPETQHTRLVGDLVVTTGMQPVHIEAVGLVTGLHGAGSDPGPSPQRAALIDEMKIRGVVNPNAFLSSGNVSLVLVQGWLRPGIQKGDRFDIEVRVPSQSETASLRGGYLLETRLQEMAVLEGQVHPGNKLAVAKGPVLVDPTADPKKDRVAACRGRVLGGGVFAGKTRPIGLVLTPGHQSVKNSARVAAAVSKRFHTFQSGIQTGVAKAKTDEFVELTVHPRYKDNIARYIQVILALPLTETPPERTRRVAILQERLMNPETAAEAAIQLEAIGVDGAETLLKGIRSPDPEVRFYAAEALAYLDRREAAEPLGEIAKNQPAFRVFALTALSAMQDFAAYDELRSLLSSPSAETRYGAFRALTSGGDSKNPLVKGEVLGDQFHYHVLNVSGPPMIHVTRNRQAEVVMFGADQRFQTPMAINAGSEIMITCREGDQIAVSKYSVSEGDQRRIVSTRIDEVIRAVVELGGTYPDVVQALQEAKNAGLLVSRFEVDALPEAGREYDRVADNGEGEADGDKVASSKQTRVAPASPAPDLFYQRGDKSAASDDAKKQAEADDESDEEPAKKKGFFSKLFGK